MPSLNDITAESFHVAVLSDQKYNEPHSTLTVVPPVPTLYVEGTGTPLAVIKVHCPLYGEETGVVDSEHPAMQINALIVARLRILISELNRSCWRSNTASL